MSQAITVEIKLDKLLRKMISILVENAGATKGVVFLEREQGLYAEVEYDLNHDELRVLDNAPIEAYHDAPIDVVEHCHHQRVTLDTKAINENVRWSTSQYFVERKVLSIHCFPLVSQGLSVGVIYLENSELQNAFDIDRLKAMNFLSSLMAISVQNAHLYKSLEKKNINVQTLLEATKSINQCNNKIDAIKACLPYKNACTLILWLY